MTEQIEKRDIVVPSRLFPFHAKADAQKFNYRNFQLINVHQKITDAQRQLCIDMWTEEGLAMSESELAERSKQVCYLFMDIETGILAGVNTLYRQFMPYLQSHWFANRSFIRPQFRTSRLAVIGVGITIYYSLLHLSHDSGTKGLVSIQENVGLQRPGIRSLYAKGGFRYSHNILKNEVWLLPFDEVKLVSSNL